jgi:glycosyltransferase involved in cell wall biosynthesis
MPNNLNSNSKKILFVIDNLGSGGAQNQLTLLAVGLKEKGYDVSVFTYFPQDFFKNRLISNQIKHFEHQKTDKLGIGVIRALANILKTEKFDTIISFLDTPNFYAAMAKKWSFSKAKLIISYRSKTEFEKLSWTSLKIKEWTNNNADKIVANSNHEAKAWTDRYEKLNNKVTVIYNVVELTEDNGNLPKSNQKNRLLVVGTVSEFKNGKIIVDALGKLKKEGYGFSLTWLGRKGLSNDTSYFDEMSNLIQKYNLTENWIWVEPNNKIKVETYYLSHTVLLLASKIEGLPNVVCEAMLLGVPIIISNCLDHPLLVKEPENGFLFNPDNSNDLAEKLSSFFALNEAQLENISQNNQKRAKLLFNKQQFIDNYSTIL